MAIATELLLGIDLGTASVKLLVGDAERTGCSSRLASLQIKPAGFIAADFSTVWKNIFPRNLLVQNRAYGRRSVFAGWH